MEASTKINNFLINLDLRIDETSLSKKEMNLSFETNDPLNISINYHETHKDAFIEKSNDTEYLGINLQKEINDNLTFEYSTNIDLRNNFNSYYDIIGLKISDECSELSIQYSNRSYNDNYNTTPEQLFSINFYMDYLGFFGYQQTTDLFFQKPGNIDYGL